MRFGWILFLLISFQTARAQDASAETQVPPPPVLAPPLVKAPAAPEPPPLVLDFSASPRPPIVLETGERVRVETTGGQSQSGELVSLKQGALSLQASPEQVANFLLTDVQRLETRTRSPGYGALIGGGSGALLGALGFGLLCVGLSDGGDTDAGACALGGGALVGAMGAGLGVLLGLALPHWSTVYDRDEQGPLSLRLEPRREEEISDWLSARGFVGELGLQLGYARDLGITQPTQGWGGRLHLLAQFGPYLALGPEVAWYSHVGTETRAGPFGGSHFDRSLLQLGGLVRGGVEIGPTRTALLLGLGLHDNRTSHLGGSAGIEVELDPGRGGPLLALDVRYHLPLIRTEGEPVEKFLSFGLGSRLRW